MTDPNDLAAMWRRVMAKISDQAAEVRDLIRDTYDQEKAKWDLRVAWLYWDAPGVHMSPERKGRTDCRECMHYGGVVKHLLRNPPIPVHLCRSATGHEMHGGFVEYCGRFVEIIL